MKAKGKLTATEWDLRYGKGPVGPILEELGIKTPTDTEELEKLNTLMDQIFGLSEIQNRTVPLRYLLACEALSIRSITGIGFKMLLPERPFSVPSRSR